MKEKAGVMKPPKTPNTKPSICMPCARVRHGIVLSAMESSTLKSSAMDSSAMNSSAIGVGVTVLVGKFMQGPWSAVPDIRSIR